MVVVHFSAPRLETTTEQARTRTESLIGRTLGEFVVREKLGEGGFGAVFRAEQPLLAREAVIKVLNSRGRISENAIQRFLREARLASSLDHPYAAHIYAFGAEPDGLLWIAMELVRGATLDKLLRLQGPLPLVRFVPLFDRICEVVHTAHEQGIVHRDLKPANVMVLSRAGRLLPKLLDFGVAKLREHPDDNSGSAAPNTGPDGVPRGTPAESAEDHPDWKEVSGRLARAITSEITQRGPFVGSPPYMAPEQWVSAAAADARTDIYALGVLCFEALTGRRPFDGDTVLDVARGHAQKPVPPLGSNLPESLGPVLERAMAKKSGDRFATALEFSAAFRTAAGLVEEADQVPQLDETVRETVIATGPQPLAEAVGALEAARTVAQAHEAVALVFRVVARWLGILALACRSRIGPGQAQDSETVLEHLELLRRQSLTNPQWMTLARELCRPFCRLPEAYPIPEVISFFFESEADESAAARLLEVAPTQSSSAGDGKHELLARELSQLAQLLRTTSFFSDYPLVVTRGTTAESWMGVRRNRRISRVLKIGNLPPNQPMLIDRSGAPMLSLWPLAQVMTPSPGAAEELFLLEGTGRHGAKLAAIPLGFERHDEALWDWCQEHLVALSGHEAAAASEERTPYLGLASFTSEDTKNFFGREKEAEAFANRLRIQALLAVVGPSGAGKSSFIQAGVIPLLPSGWRAFTLRPGPTPFAALAAKLGQEGVSLSPSAIAGRPEIVGQALRENARRSGGTVVLIVDQFEELLTLCPDASERELFARALVAAATDPGEPVRVILTLRDDFLIRAQQLAPLREGLAQSLQLVGTPAPEDLMRILIQPARQLSYEFEEPQLPQEMVKEVAEQPGALALLSFTASKLWELRDRQFRHLSRRAYHSLGGVGGALARHAELTLGEMPAAEQALVREAFRHLVTPDRTRAVLTRGEMQQLLGGGTAAQAVLERLISARLLVASEAQGGEDRIEIIHEALLTSWPRLVGWQQEDAESARMRHQLRAAARQWDERGRGKGLLWRDEALMEYRLWRARSKSHLTETEEAFAAASLSEEVRSRRVKRLAVTAAFLALAVGLVVLFRANKVAGENARESKARLADLYLEHGRQLVLADDPIRALLYLDKAYQAGAPAPPVRFLIGRATRMLDMQVALLPHDDQVVDARFSPDGKRAVTASWDKTAKLWDAATGKLVAQLKGHTGRVWSARFSRDGERIVSASIDGTARIWDGRDGHSIAVLELTHPAPPPRQDLRALADFSPDGRWIAAGIADTVQIWDAQSYQRSAELKGYTGWIRCLLFHPDGESLFTGDQDGVLKRWDVSGRLRYSIQANQSPFPVSKWIWAMSLSRDGARLATAGYGELARVWEAKSGQRVSEVQEPEGMLHAIALSPDGATLVTGGDSKFAKVWDASSGSLLRVLEGHASAIWYAGYSEDGTKIVTTSGDGTAQVRRADGGATLAKLIGHVDGVNFAEFAKDGRVVTTSPDSSARIWNPQHGIRRWSRHESKLFSFAGFSADGQRALIADGVGRVEIVDSESGTAKQTLILQPDDYGAGDWSSDGSRLVLVGTDSSRLFEIPSGRVIATMPGHRPPQPLLIVAFSPDGQRFAITDDDRVVRIRDAQDGKVLHSFGGYRGELRVVSFDATGSRLATGDTDRKVVVWDVASGARLLTLDDFKGEVRSVNFSPDGSRLVTASRDKRLMIWDARTGQPLLRFEEAKWANINWAQFSPDGERMVTGDVAGALGFWDARSGKLLSSYVPLSDAMGSARFSRDGSRVISTLQQDVVSWDSQTDARSSGEVSSYVRCHIPFQLEGDKLVQVQVPSTCR